MFKPPTHPKKKKNFLLIRFLTKRVSVLEEGNGAFFSVLGKMHSPLNFNRERKKTNGVVGKEERDQTAKKAKR